ncbi:MAG TPA: DUF5666 domain-containing protein [Anaerolineales bacterium]
MADILVRFRKWFSEVLPTWFLRRWLRLAGMIALAVILLAGINAITNSEEETQAATGLDERSPEASNFPYDFQFTGQGRITAGAEGVWVIGGIPIHVDERTRLMSTFHVGDFVSLSGRIVDRDAWVADRIEPSQEKNSHYIFNGPLEWVRGSIWRLGGHSLLVNLGTELGSNLASSDVLLATFTVLESGAWQALEIKAFDPTVFEPTPTSTLAPTESRRKVEPTATILPASPEGSDGGDDESESKADDDDDDGKDKHDDNKRDDKDKGKQDDDDDDD